MNETKQPGPLEVRFSDQLGHSPHVKSVARYAKAMNMRRAGQTLQAIGTEMGVSRERVRQMVKKAERLEQEKLLAAERPHLTLSVRTRNCLRSEYWHTYRTQDRGDPPLKLVREWLDSGALKKVPGMGKRSIAETAAWLAANGA
jgi:predicted transcriptional regulator